MAAELRHALLAAVLLPALAGRAPAQTTRPAEELLPATVRQAVQRVLPSLVTIETFDTSVAAAGKARQRSRAFGIFNPGEGPTTGLVVSAQGHILTSTFHFLGQPRVIVVELADGAQHVARLLGRDNTRRLCLLKIDPPAGTVLVPPRLVPRRDVKVGQWAISVGLGLGDPQPAVSLGMVSAASRIYGRAIQTDANISPANYGGPLVDVEGRVIGVCAPLSPQLTEPLAGAQWYDSGIGFAVPLEASADWLEQLKQGRTINPGRLGILAEDAADDPPTPPASAPATAPATFPAVEGVRVRQVRPESAAQRAGLRPGDLITAVDDQPVRELMDLRLWLGRRVAGDSVTLHLLRGPERLSVSATLESGEEDSAATRPSR